jgi:hypothetical protein
MGFLIVGTVDVLLRPNPARVAASDKPPPPIPAG